MVRSVTWPYEFGFAPNAQPIVYEHISIMAFVDRYITVMAKESLHIKTFMLELMKDGECYGWPALMAYHEQVRAVWGDKEKKMKLVWDQVGHSSLVPHPVQDTLNRLINVPPTQPDGELSSASQPSLGTRLG